MTEYIISILVFLFINFLLSVTIKKYTFENFFLYVILYFFVINIINYFYIGSINFFSFLCLFLASALFLYAGLYRSVSVKVMIYLYFKNKNVSVNKYYNKEFINSSFNKRIKILIKDGILIKKKQNIKLSNRGLKYLRIFKNIQSFYKIKFSG